MRPPGGRNGVRGKDRASGGSVSCRGSGRAPGDNGLGRLGRRSRISASGWRNSCKVAACSSPGNCKQNEIHRESNLGRAGARKNNACSEEIGMLIINVTEWQPCAMSMSTRLNTRKTIELPKKLHLFYFFFNK